jgi:hypothetical protein
MAGVIWSICTVNDSKSEQFSLVDGDNVFLKPPTAPLTIVDTQIVQN